MKNFATILSLLLPLLMLGQIAPGVYTASETLENGKRNYQLLVTDSLSLIHISEPTRPTRASGMPSWA